MIINSLNQNTLLLNSICKLCKVLKCPKREYTSLPNEHVSGRWGGVRVGEGGGRRGWSLSRIGISPPPDKNTNCAQRVCSFLFIITFHMGYVGNQGRRQEFKKGGAKLDRAHSPCIRHCRVCRMDQLQTLDDDIFEKLLRHRTAAVLWQLWSL